MKRDILIVDWLMLAVFAMLILSKIFSIVMPPIIQPIFMVLIAVHIIQHWKIIVASVKRRKK